MIQKEKKKNKKRLQLMHPSLSSSSSSSTSSFSDFHEVPFLTTYKVTLPRMTNINKTNTMVQKRGGWRSKGWWDWNNLMKPALQKKKKTVSHGPTLSIFFFLRRVKGNRSDSADSTVTVMSSQNLQESIVDQGPQWRKEGGDGVCLHGNIRGR